MAKKKRPRTRKEAIRMIDRAGKRKEFEDSCQNSLEDYFEMYSYKEPAIWTWVLSDLGIA